MPAAAAPGEAVAPIEVEDPENVCHLFDSERWPIALCGHNLTGRSDHSRAACRAAGHTICTKCALLDAPLPPGGDPTDPRDPFSPF